MAYARWPCTLTMGVCNTLLQHLINLQGHAVEIKKIVLAP
jgi:hypothetical protein